MARKTLLIGFVLVVMGLWGYLEGHHTSAALMPAYFGIILGMLGVTARTSNASTRKIVMHIAVVVGLVGFLMTARSLWDYVQMQRGLYTGDQPMMEEKAMMSAILLIFVLLCVLSFIHARRERQATPETRLGPGKAS